MNLLRRLALQGKKTWWLFASRCRWNRARPWRASQLLSFLVGLRTYQHPCTCVCMYVYIYIYIYITSIELHVLNLCTFIIFRLEKYKFTNNWTRVTQLTITIFMGFFVMEERRKTEMIEWKKKGEGTCRRGSEKGSKDEMRDDGNKEEKKESAKQSYIL